MEYLSSYYDFIITELDAIPILVDIYGVAYSKIIGISHGGANYQTLIDKKGPEIFIELANFGVVSDILFGVAIALGVPRIPQIVPYGINYSEFYADVAERLVTVGYGASISQLTKYGQNWKRGELAEACAQEA